MLTQLKLFDVLQSATEQEEIRVEKLKSKMESEQGNSGIRINGPRDRMDYSDDEMTTKIGSANSASIGCSNVCGQGNGDSRDAVEGEVSDLRKTVSGNESFDSPIAFDVNTPALAVPRRGCHESEDSICDERGANISQTRPFYCEVNKKGDSALPDEEKYTKIADPKQHQDIVSSFKASFDVELLGGHQQGGNSQELKVGEDESKERSQAVLPSNINHYPNIFTLDEDFDESAGEAWPFSFQQDDPTQQPVSGKRKVPLGHVKLPHSDCSGSVNEYSAQQRSKDSESSRNGTSGSCNVAQNQLTAESNSSSQRECAERKLKKFKFKRIVP